ncbi:phytoene desaturase family protein [Candidatus Omnitrophota bacterium]
MKKRIAIVGAGVGGLATAARLASRGYEVDVFEKLSECGGRAHIIEDKGFKFDTGPSFVLMPDFFAEVFSYCGKDMRDYLDLRMLDSHYKIFFPSGKELTIYRETDRTIAELERFEPGCARAYNRFLGDGEKNYEILKPLLYQCFTKSKILNPSYWDLVFKLKIGTSYWKYLKQFFKSDDLCYVLTFEAMFIGVSPFEAPAFYSVITYADHAQKIHHPMGGMYKIPKALERLSREFGVRFHYQNEVQSIISTKGALKIKTQQGELGVDKVIANADYAYAQSGLLGRKLPNFEYSCSVYLLYLGLKQKVKGLEHHNIFFAHDLKKNLKDIFHGKVMPNDPSFYIHVPTVTDSSLAPEGKDLFYILVPVPNLAGSTQNFEQQKERLRKIIFDRINAKLGMRLQDLIDVEYEFCPQDFITRYNVMNGATFGLAHTLFQSAFFRPANIDSRIKNLYYVGASTQPGGGLPPVIASSRIVADLITKEKVS